MKTKKRRAPLVPPSAPAANVPKAPPALPLAKAGEPDLGACLRQIRFTRRLTLADVSVATGIAKSTLSRVENGQLSLTYDKVLQLCRGLQIDIAELFAKDPARLPAQPAGRRTYTAPDGGRSLAINLQSYNYLCTDLANKRMTPMTGVVHSRTFAETNGLMKHDGEEFTYVLEGRLELHPEFYEPLVVETGGSVYFDSTMGHAYVSIGATPLKMLVVCSTPEPVLTGSLSAAAPPTTIVAKPRRSRR